MTDLAKLWPPMGNGDISPDGSPPTRLLTALDRHVVSLGRFSVATKVADLLGISPATLRRLREADPEHLGPCMATWFREVQVWLYDGAAIDRLVAHRDTQTASGRARAGRPRLWDSFERHDRRIRHSQASYQRRRARQLREAGDATAAQEHDARATAISRALRLEEQARRTDPAALEAMNWRSDTENRPLVYPQTYWHGICMIDHRTAAAAQRCRWSCFDPDKELAALARWAAPPIGD